MKKSRIFGYSAITLFIVIGIILAVLGALGYLTPKSGSGSSPVLSGSVSTTLNEIQLHDIRPMWGVCINGSPKTFDGVEYRLQTACEQPTCNVNIKTTYEYPDGSTDVTSRALGNSGIYHNPPTNSTKIPVSAHIDTYSVSGSETYLQNSYTMSISQTC